MSISMERVRTPWSLCLCTLKDKRMSGKARSEAYKEYLKSEHWLELKKNKAQRIPHCQICGAKERLHLHHVRYRKTFRETLPCDLRWLCQGCHRSAHHHIESGLIPKGKNVKEVFGITAEVVMGYKDQPWGGVFRVKEQTSEKSFRSAKQTRVEWRKLKPALANGPAGVVVVRPA